MKRTNSKNQSNPPFPGASPEKKRGLNHLRLQYRLIFVDDEYYEELLH